MLVVPKAVVCCCLLMSLAGAEAQVNPPASCPNAIPRKSAKLTVKQKLVTALFAAVEDDNLRAVKRLLAQHADANARDLHSSTSLMFAVVCADTHVDEPLIGTGADMNA